MLAEVSPVRVSYSMALLDMASNMFVKVARKVADLIP